MEIVTRGNYVNCSTKVLILLLLLVLYYVAVKKNSSVSKEINSNVTKEINSSVRKEINRNLAMKIKPNVWENIENTKGKMRSKVELIAPVKTNTSKILPCLPDFYSNHSKFVKHDNISLVFEKIRKTKLENPTKTRKLVSIRNSDSDHGKEYILIWDSSDDTNTTTAQERLLIVISSETLLKLATLLKVFHYLLTKWRRNYQKSIDEKNKRKIYDFLFQFRDHVYCSVNLYMYPNSLKQYLNGLEKNSDKNAKCMNNEWARLESFKTFPEDCPVSTLKLAKAGFYSTENGKEAICFSCGLKNDIWTDTETVADVHKRLSPGCKFLNGDTTENVSIHGDDKQSQGACGGPEDNEGRREEAHQPMKEKSGSQTSQNLESNDERVTSQNASSNDNSCNSSSENGRNFEYLNSYRGQYSENIPTEEIRHFPGITNEQPKHPDYAIKRERSSSFSNWTASNVVKPEDLAEAGFFFCGVQDLVRCFFCGGGMKNWEYGDSPWIEHARWFPTCAFLKQCKGEDFINLCQISSMTFPSQSNFQLRDLNAEPTTNVADQQIKDLNSIAAKRVLDMGYTQPQVENAIKETRQRIGHSEDLKAQNLLEYLLDNSYTPANVPTSTSSAQNHTSDVINSNSSSRSSSHVTSERQISPKEERKQLQKENQNLKEQKMCKVCMDKDANIVFLPCGHLVSCVECAHALRKCAVCRAIIQGTVRAYQA